MDRKESFDIASIQEKLRKTLQEITKRATKKFSGIGLIVCNGKMDPKCSMNLKPNINVPKNLKLGNKGTTNYLLKISNVNHPAHDGYVFFGKDGKLKSISQYIQVQINPKIKPHPTHGVRYLTSLLASEMEGIEVVGNVSTSKDCYIFEKGEVFPL